MTDPWPLPDAETCRREVEDRVGEDLAARLAGVQLLVLDCDGVMTDGTLLYGPGGEELKAFDARDGLGLMMLHRAQIARAVLTGRTSAMVERRCRDLAFEAIAMGRFDKRDALAEIWQQTGVDAAATLYVGDDLLDLPAITACGLAATVPAAAPEVAAACALVTRAPGGSGAVREICDLLLKARGQYASAIAALAAGGRPGGRGPEVTH